MKCPYLWNPRLPVRPICFHCGLETCTYPKAYPYIQHITMQRSKVQALSFWCGIFMCLLELHQIHLLIALSFCRSGEHTLCAFNFSTVLLLFAPFAPFCFCFNAYSALDKNFDRHSALLMLSACALSTCYCGFGLLSFVLQCNYIAIFPIPIKVKNLC